MSWKDLLQSEGTPQVFPWVGSKYLWDQNRRWTIFGQLPPEHGWYFFSVGGNRKAILVCQAEQPPDFDKWTELSYGYLVGDRLIPDDVRVNPDPKKLIKQTHRVFLVELGLELFTRAVVAKYGPDLIFLRQEFPLGPEDEVLRAYQDRKDSVADIPKVTPALDLAFRWVSLQRSLAEKRREEMERLRVEEERRREIKARQEEAMKMVGTAAGRRAVAEVDFETAAKAALALSGAGLLACRPSRNRDEMVVQYRFQHRRFECVVDRRTLRIVDAGVCLTDHAGVKGDTWLSLESLPAVIREGMANDELVVDRKSVV